MIRPLRESDVEAAVALRREALEDAPLAFSASPEEDLGSDPGAVRARIADGPDSVLLGAFDEGRLVGIAAVFRERPRKLRHRVSLFGMYVTPSHRRRGIASELVAAAVRHARALPGVAWLELSVSSGTPDARRVYEAAAFEPWGVQTDALRDGDRSTALLHMRLAIGPAPPDVGV